MKLANVILVIVGGCVIFSAGYGLQRWTGAPPSPPAESTPAPGSDQNIVRFAPGATQLQFLKIDPIVFLPEPLLEPLNGRVAYDENYTTRVSSPIAGRVVKIDVQAGDRVKTGAALAWIDAPDYGTALADARKAENDMRQKARELSRAKEMLDAGVIPRKDFEAADTDARQAQTELQRAQSRLRNLTPGGKAVGEDERLALRAPISGVIVDRKINPGAEVRPDAPDPLFVITDPAHVWVIIDLPERYLGKVRVGQVVSIEVDAYSGVDISGRVASIGEALDPATRRVQVRCVVDNSRQLLKPEMFARVVPLSEERQKLARVPNSALLSEGLYTFVFVQKAPGVFEKRQVSLGLQGRDESYVKSGLAEGDRVVASGALLLESELSSRR
jgi:cobalt-zinc-cadmium efflux system membrane fusion protein